MVEKCYTGLMLLSSRGNIQDHLVTQIAKGPKTVLELQETLSEEGCVLTLQGIYKALEKPIESNVVVKEGRVLVLSEEWRKDLASFFGTAQSQVELKEGEKLSYSFNSLDRLDAYWKHVLTSIQRAYPKHSPFFFNPHEIWIHLPKRQASEEKYLEDFRKKAQRAFLTIGGTSTLDRWLKKKYQSDHLQINLCDDLPFLRTDHITIIGDYIVTTRLRESTAQKIDKIFQNATDPDEAKRPIAAISGEMSKITFKLEKNRAKSEKIRKRLSRDFVIPRSNLTPKK